jgi:hypothetical protein
MMERHGVDGPENDEVFMYAVANIAFGLGAEEAKGYFWRKEGEMNCN